MATQGQAGSVERAPGEITAAGGEGNVGKAPSPIGKPDTAGKKQLLTHFDLVANARDSLAHGVAHLAGPNGSSPANLKIAVREVTHVVELLLKERLHRVHPAFVWEQVDRYPALDAQTVTTEKTVARLGSICGISLSSEARASIAAGRKLRNAIEHYSFQLNEKEARVIIGRLLSFIFDFSRRHLNLDLEDEFRRNDRWKTLVEMFEFWQAHAKATERRLREAKKDTMECPSCLADTFDTAEQECALCGHHEDLVVCDHCGEAKLESEMHSVSLDQWADGLICEGCYNFGGDDRDRIEDW